MNRWSLKACVTGPLIPLPLDTLVRMSPIFKDCKKGSLKIYDRSREVGRWINDFVYHALRCYITTHLLSSCTCRNAHAHSSKRWTTWPCDQQRRVWSFRTFAIFGTLVWHMHHRITWYTYALIFRCVALAYALTHSPFHSSTTRTFPWLSHLMHFPFTRQTRYVLCR